MALADIVNISISSETAAVTQAGFGTPMILGFDCPGGFTEYVRYYTNTTDMVSDGFSATGPTVKMATRVFAQSPRVVRLAVGRCAATYAQTWTITPTAANSTVYKLNIAGNLVSYTSDSSATVTEISTGLKTAIDLLSITGVTCTIVSTKLHIALTAGLSKPVYVPANMLSLLDLVQDTADVSLAADLAAIAVEDNSWYGILLPYASSALIQIVATYAEANEKLFIAQTQDSAVITVSNGSDSTSIAHVLKAAADARTALIYSANNEDFADGGWAGKCLPLDPGSETWKFKTLAGVTVSTLTTTQQTNAQAKYCNVYTTVAGVNITQEGLVAANEFIDVIRFRDWLRARMAESIFGALARTKKIPFTDAGIAVVEGLVRAQLQAGVEVGGLSSSPAPVVTVPKAADISDSDKAARTLRNVKFDAVLAGAIHFVTISGTITV